MLQSHIEPAATVFYEDDARPSCLMSAPCVHRARDTVVAAPTSQEDASAMEACTALRHARMHRQTT